MEDVLRPLDGDTDERGRQDEQCGAGDGVQIAAKAGAGIATQVTAEIMVHGGTSGRTAAAGPGSDADVSISSWFTDAVLCRPPA
ncbi:hypothetical protein GCM10027075_51760 [Streptomyces heilongjiangensis]